MSDATIRIKVEGDTPGTEGSSAPEADLTDRWRRLSDTMGRAIDDLNARANRFKALEPAGSAGIRPTAAPSPFGPADHPFLPPPPAGKNPYVFPGPTGSPGAAPPPAPAGTPPTSPTPPPKNFSGRFSQLDFDSQRRAALNGRPEGVTDREWADFGKENARRGAAAAKVAGKAQEQIQRQRAEAEARAERELAERDRIAEQKRKDAEAVAQARQAQNARYAQIAATAALGSGPGKYQQAGGALGSVAGTIIGGRFGPVGAAVGQVVGQKAGEKIGERIDDPLAPLTKKVHVAGEAIRWLGEGAAKVAGNDGVGAFKQAVGGAAAGLEKIPIAGKFAAEGLRVAGSAATVVKDTLDAFAARGKELQNYNGAIASASARQDVAFLKADIDEAQRMGPGYAKLIEMQTKIDLTLRELLLPIKEWIAEKLPPTIDAGVDAVIRVLKFIEFSSPLFVWKFGKISEELEKIRKKIEEAVGVGAGVDLVSPLLDGIENLMAPEPLAAPAPFAIPPIVALP